MLSRIILLEYNKGTGNTLANTIAVYAGASLLFAGAGNDTFGHSGSRDFGGSIVTLLVAFLNQYAQNLDTRAIQLKLDELLPATEGAGSARSDRSGSALG